MPTCDARATGQMSTRAHNLRRNTRKTCHIRKSPLNRAISAVVISALVVTGLSIIGLVGTAGTAEAATARPEPPQEVIDAIVAHFPPSQVDNALAVTYCESRWLTNERTAGATKPNVGIFQINRVHRKRLAAEGFTWDDVRLNLDINAKIASDLWRTQGWRPWTCKKALPTNLRRMMPTQEELLWVPPAEQEPAPAEPAPPVEVAPPVEAPIAAPPGTEPTPAAPPVTTPPVAAPPVEVTPPPLLDPLANTPMPPSTDLLPGGNDPVVTTPIPAPPGTTTPVPITTSPLPNSSGPPATTTPSLLPAPVFGDPVTGPVIGEPLVVAPPAAAPILAMFSAAHRVIPIKRATPTVPSLSARIRIQTATL